MARKRQDQSAFLVFGLLLAAGSVLHAQQAKEQAGAPSTPSGLPVYDKNIMAYVNGQAITRQELADELVARKGRQHLQAMINRKIIEQAAKSAGFTVTDAEIDAEVMKLAHFAQCNSAKDYEEKVLKYKHNTTLFEYREDVIKYGLYMRKLVGQSVMVSEEDIHKAYDAKFGEKVKCRAIISVDHKKALEVHTAIRQEAEESKDPKDGLRQAFLRYARLQTDPGLAGTAGDIQPIGHFTLLNVVEERAFALRDGEMSEVLEVPDGTSKAFMILLRENLTPANHTVPFKDTHDELREEILDRKMRAEVPKYIQKLRQAAMISDYLNNQFDIKEVLMRQVEEQDRRKMAPAGSASAQKK
jgi:hypothetical protein